MLMIYQSINMQIPFIGTVWMKELVNFNQEILESKLRHNINKFY